ncbi:alpha/beta hydrolase [Microbacterium insulae]|uniref:Alpha/beta hydrolase n=1 Tax=Microbacterium insulae TaxID=483014 RepID=A0ABW3AH02_9MICO
MDLRVTDGAVDVAAFQMPFTRLASAEARAEFVRRLEQQRVDAADERELDVHAIRALVDAEVEERIVRQRPFLAGPVAVEPWIVDGVYTDIFTPDNADADRILINLHGGGFQIGARTVGRLESLPIAALSGMRVVSVDYRMAPEHTFPAASEDVLAVYDALLRNYAPGRIGIFGSSAGGTLVSQAVAWFVEQGRPLPGAVAMLCGTGHPWWSGDSGHLDSKLYGTRGFDPDAGWSAVPYMADADPGLSTANPLLWPEVLAQFPPSLLVSGSRSYDLSSIIDAHNRLSLAGARSSLHVWDGVGHCFYLRPELPESREVERIVVQFFQRELASGDAPTASRPAHMRGARA